MGDWSRPSKVRHLPSSNTPACHAGIPTTSQLTSSLCHHGTYIESTPRRSGSPHRTVGTLVDCSICKVWKHSRVQKFPRIETDICSLPTVPISLIVTTEFPSCTTTRVAVYLRTRRCFRQSSPRQSVAGGACNF
jgi:hypothetical protein